MKTATKGDFRIQSEIFKLCAKGFDIVTLISESFSRRRRKLIFDEVVDET